MNKQSSHVIFMAPHLQAARIPHASAPCRILGVPATTTRAHPGVPATTSQPPSSSVFLPGGNLPRPAPAPSYLLGQRILVRAPPPIEATTQHLHLPSPGAVRHGLHRGRLHPWTSRECLHAGLKSPFTMLAAAVAMPLEVFFTWMCEVQLIFVQFRSSIVERAASFFFSLLPY